MSALSCVKCVEAGQGGEGERGWIAANLGNGFEDGYCCCHPSVWCSPFRSVSDQTLPLHLWKSRREAHWRGAAIATSHLTSPNN